MARPEFDRPLLPSILDRLLHGTDVARWRVSELRSAIRRDLEALLNTRQRCLSPAPDLRELATSLLEYGMPDLTAGRGARMKQHAVLRAAIESAIRRFEPRLSGVEVTIIDDPDVLDRTARFRIAGIIAATDGREVVTYASRLDPVTRDFAVVVDS